MLCETAVQAALEALPTIGGGNVAVVQNANVYRVNFINGLSGVNVPLFDVTGTAGAVVNDAYGLIVSKNLILRELGLNNTGALRSVSGQNHRAHQASMTSLSRR